jgi:hypothetical protein
VRKSLRFFPEMMAIISNENETEDIYLLDIPIKETPQKQPHTQSTRSNGANIICNSPNIIFNIALQNFSQHDMSSFLAQQQTENSAIFT